MQSQQTSESEQENVTNFNISELLAGAEDSEISINTNPPRQDREIEIDVQNEESKTPLWIAAANGDLGAVKYLVKKNADMEVEDQNKLTPLEIAIKNGHFEVVKYLWECIEDMDPNVFFEIAAKNDHIDLIDFFLEEGANIEGGGRLGDLPLHLAIREKRFEVVKHLLDKDENLEDILESLDAEGNTPLHAAAEVGNLRAVKLLVKRGADVEATNNSNITPLFFATSFGHLEVVKYLVKIEADVNAASSDNNTPLHCAVEHGSKMVRLLLENGSEINAQDDDGNTPLHCAVEHGPKMVRLLVKNGANIDAENEEGDTPLDLAIDEEKLSSALVMFSSINLTDERLSKLKECIKDLIDKEYWSPLEKAKGLLNILDDVMHLEQPEAVKIKKVLSKNIQPIIKKVIPLIIKQAVKQETDISSIMLSILGKDISSILKDRDKLMNCNELSQYLEEKENIKGLINEKFPKFSKNLKTYAVLSKNLTLGLYSESFKKAAEGLTSKKADGVTFKKADGVTFKKDVDGLIFKEDERDSTFEKAAAVLAKVSNADGPIKNIISFLNIKNQNALLIATLDSLTKLQVGAKDLKQIDQYSSKHSWDNETGGGAATTVDYEGDVDNSQAPKRHKSSNELSLISYSIPTEEVIATSDVTNMNDEPNLGLVGSSMHVEDSATL